MLDKIYDASHWVTFIDPKVDLNFFKNDPEAKDLLIIHYSDQYTTAGGYDAITVTRKSGSYQRVIEVLDDGVDFVVDAEKDLLMKTLPYHPFLIKPNNLELEEIFDVKLKNDSDIVACGKKLQALGARNVLISMAKDGAILIDENGTIYQQGVCKGTVVNSVGAGDSMVAGFIAGVLKERDYSKALKLATACGGATAFHSGLATYPQIMKAMKTLG